MKTAAVILSLNAVRQGDFRKILESYRDQDCSIDLKMLADSGSDDGTIALAEEFGWEIKSVCREKFDHGLTRDSIVRELDAQGYDTVIFATQDVLPENSSSLKNLLDCLHTAGAGAAYARQTVLNKDSFDGVFREKNYPAESMLKSRDSISELGLMTVFCSNAMAAWDIKKLLAAGGFPQTSFGEDMLAAASLIRHGETIAYCAESRCIHEHNGSATELWKRGRDIGTLHAEHPELAKEFGSPRKSVSKHIGINTVKHFFWQLSVKYAGYLYAHAENKLKNTGVLLPFICAVIIGSILMFFNKLPANDTCTRYAPMAEAFADGMFKYAYHPMYGTSFQTISGIICFITGLDGFRSCQFAALLLWASAVFPLHSLSLKIWDRKTALFAGILYLLCSHLHRYIYDGLRDNGRTLGIALLALGIVTAFRQIKDRNWWWQSALGCGILTTLRADGFLISCTALALLAFMDLYKNRLRCWRSAAAGVLFLLLILPQMILTYEYTDIFMPSSRHASIITKITEDGK